MESRAPKLLDCVRTAVRTRQYSRRTEDAYVHWIKRYIVFHGKVHPASLGAEDVAAFLSWLAERRHVSFSTQNQALSAVLFLYRNVLGVDRAGIPPVVRARASERLPVVLSREEVMLVLKHLTGTIHLIVTLLYGAGLRLDECLGLRVKDLDFDRDQITVRQGKGRKEAFTSTSRWCKRQWRMPHVRRESPSAWDRTRCATASRRTCSRRVMTSERCRSCWGIETCGRR